MDPAKELLWEREYKALRMSTMVRFAMIAIMAPMVWLLGTSMIDRVATTILLAIYVIVLAVSTLVLNRRKHLTIISLTGVAVDVCVIATLPLIWHASLGGGDLPAGITLKSSVTLVAFLFITLNTLAMRPLYPLLATTGALIIHAVLLNLGLNDSHTEFTTSYLVAYTSPAISSGRVVTQFVIILLSGLVLTLLTMRARNMVVEAAELQKRNIQLGRYFSPNLVKRLEDAPELLQVGGERKDLSFVFTDLEGFTSLVENNEPSLVVSVLNEYLDELIRIAFRHEGTVEKIVGDALHVIFGAPNEQPDHAVRAIACALEMDAAAQKFRAQINSRIPVGVTRIGVNSGSAIVGNFGGEDYFDYTAHGDSINIAARLERANKYLGTRICVSSDTKSRIKNFRGRPIGVLLLKGKNQDTEVFEPLDDSTGDRVDPVAYLRAYESLKACHPDACKEFSEYCSRYPDDALAAFHLKRLQAGHTGSKIILESK